MRDAEHLPAILGFLNEIGIHAETGPTPEDAFLPGLHVDHGRVIIDPARAGSPGDALHEAGHIACCPSRFWSKLTGDFGPWLTRMAEGPEPEDLGGAAPPSDLERAALFHNEQLAIAWSYAALHHLGLDWSVVFYPGTYNHPPGQAPIGIIQMLEMRLFPGIDMLATQGLTVRPARFVGDPVLPGAYPAMTRWLLG